MTDPAADPRREPISCADAGCDGCDEPHHPDVPDPADGRAARAKRGPGRHRQIDTPRSHR